MHENILFDLNLTRRIFPSNALCQKTAKIIKKKLSIKRYYLYRHRDPSGIVSTPLNRTRTPSATRASLVYIHRNSIQTSVSIVLVNYQFNYWTWSCRKLRSIAIIEVPYQLHRWTDIYIVHTATYWVVLIRIGRGSPNFEVELTNATGWGRFFNAYVC